MVSKAELRGEFYLAGKDDGGSYPNLLLHSENKWFYVGAGSSASEYTLTETSPALSKYLNNRVSFPHNASVDSLYRLGNDSDKLQIPGNRGVFSIDNLTLDKSGNIIRGPQTVAQIYSTVEVDASLPATPESPQPSTRNRVVFGGVAAAGIGGVFLGLKQKIGAAAAAAVTAIGAVLGVAAAIAVGDHLAHKEHSLKESLSALTKPKEAWQPALQAVLAKVDSVNIGK